MADLFDDVFTPEVIKQLNTPVPDEFIKQRKGPGGTDLDYIEWHYVSRRLDEIFNRDWEWDCDTTLTVADGKVIAKAQGTLRVGNRKLTGTGSAVCNTNANNEAVEFAIKNAASDALKRAAVYLGNAFGLHLYSKEETISFQSAPRPAHPNAPKAPHAVAPDDGIAIMCDEPACTEFLEGYQSSERSKYKGQFVTPQQLASDSQHHFQMNLCIKHYREAWDKRNSNNPQRRAG